VRKELIAFVAFALVAAAQVRERPRLAPLLAAVALFLVSVLGHEANALWTPFFLLVLLLALAQRASGRALMLGLSAGVLAGTAVLALYAVRHPTLADPTQLCEPIQDRGPPRWFCHMGAIARLAGDAADARSRITGNLTPAVRIGFALTYALAAAPVLYALACCQRRRWLVALFVLTGLAAAPLYTVATDWGRWLDLHLTVFAFVLTSLLLAGRIGPLRPARLAVALPLLVLGLLWSPAHDQGGVRGLVRATPAGVWLDGDTWRGTTGTGGGRPARQGAPRSR
jgi:hypothetical protein